MKCVGPEEDGVLPKKSPNDFPKASDHFTLPLAKYESPDAPQSH